MKCAIYPNDNGISIMRISAECKMLEKDVANKDVPLGVPYLLIAEQDIPKDWGERDAWEADFTTPDGFGGEK